MPAIQPPTDENSNAAVASVPACACDIRHRPISVGMTTAYSCTSIASSAQPVKHAQNVRRSRTFRVVNQFATRGIGTHVTLRFNDTYSYDVAGRCLRAAQRVWRRRVELLDRLH